MADEKPAADVTFTPERDTPGTLDDVFAQPDVKAITPSRERPAPSELRKGDTPAVHSDELWGGPRFIKNAQAEPVYVETKEQYWELLRKNGLRMQDQQESTTGDGPGPDPVIHVHETPHPPVLPLTTHEAEVFGAMTAVLLRYALIESLWCTHCFARRQPHGCRVLVDRNRVAIECRGGVATWAAPVGEPNPILRVLANSAASPVMDAAPGTIVTPAGPVARPARLLLDVEATIMRAYFRVLKSRGIEPRWHHRDCWRGNPWLDDDALAIYVDADQVVAVCACRQLFARTTPRS